MQTKRRAEGLDGLRALAAATIVLLHVWMFSGAHQARQSELTDRVIGTFGLSLMLFFVLSGLLLATPWVRAGSTPGKAAPRIGPYALRRIARIMPGYVVCVVASFLIMRAIDHPLAIEAHELPAFLLFAQNQFTATAGQLNPPLWSLGIEVAFYLAIPLVGLAILAALRRGSPAGAYVLCGLLAAAGLAWTAAAVDGGSDPTKINALPTYLPVFACGIAAAIALARTELGRVQRTALILTGAALVAADALWHSGPNGTGWAGHVVRDLPAGVGFAMLASAVAQGPAWILGSWPMRKLGEASFGIYLWHMPVLYVLRDQERWPVSPWEAWGLVLGIATILGTLSWQLIERPSIRLAAHWERRRAARRTPEPESARPMPQPHRLPHVPHPHAPQLHWRDRPHAADGLHRPATVPGPAPVVVARVAAGA